MPMTQRERILSVYRGETPECVPFMLDLSHWFYQKFRKPWDLSVAYEEPEYELIDYHKRSSARGSICLTSRRCTAAAIRTMCARRFGRRVLTGTPRLSGDTILPSAASSGGGYGKSRTTRGGIRDWGLKSEDDLKVLAYAMSRREFAPRWDQYQAWVDYIGDIGVAYIGAGYSGIGYLLNYWMGIEDRRTPSPTGPRPCARSSTRSMRTTSNSLTLCAVARGSYHTWG